MRTDSRQDTGDRSIQVRRIEKMHRDPIFWVNPLTDALLLVLVRHVCSFFHAE